MSPRRLTATCAALYALSGTCALVYETMWMRALRNTFGASTPATGAALAVFMGGMGLGAFLFGRRADRTAKPLLQYAVLETGVAVTAIASPVILDGLASLYFRTGGAQALGVVAATILRVVCATLALGVPATLMGGTFPTIARAVAASADVERRFVALMYGANTVGAVIGAASSTLVFLGLFGVRRTIWLAAGVNLVIALVALAVSMRAKDAAIKDSPVLAPPPRDVVAAAFASGLAFFALELVWYRISAPLLGGSTYSFGIVLAVALAGIGIGGLGFALSPPRAPTRGLLAITFALEAAFTAAPICAGDRIARLTFFLRELCVADFASLAMSWSLVTALFVLPGACVAGWQLALLLALRGRGDDNVARDTSVVYAWNTIGAIAGSLAAGFGLFPLLGAVGAWRLAVIVLVVASLPFIAGAVAPGTISRERRRAAVAALLLAFAVAFASSSGPTALWRHSGIGAGRADLHADTAAELDELERGANRLYLYSADGVESTVGVHASDGLAFIVNGKSDGQTFGDAGTAIGSAIVPALLHGSPKRAFVVGLGTGQTAGWLADVPGIENVTVVELEPAIVSFAKMCHETNREALSNPKVTLLNGDAREVLMTSKDRYDLVISEPSNPYRAGVSGFYSREFYASTLAHLNDHGVFAQWMQDYEVEPEATATVIATLSSVFPEVSLWRLRGADVLIVASLDAQQLDVPRVAADLEREPYASAMLHVLRVSGVEGLLAMNIASPDFVRTLGAGAALNTDDDPTLELSFARSVGRDLGHPFEEIAERARTADVGLSITGGTPDRALIELQRDRPFLAMGDVAVHVRGPPAEDRWSTGDFAGAARLLASDPRGAGPTSALVRAHIASLAPLNSDGRTALADTLTSLDGAGLGGDVAMIRVEQALSERDPQVLLYLKRALALARVDPWIHPRITADVFRRIARAGLGPDDAETVLELILAGPLADYACEDDRLALAQNLVVQGALDGTMPKSCAGAFVPLEPYPQWSLPSLDARARCYERHDPARAAEAAADLARAKVQR